MRAGSVVSRAPSRLAADRAKPIATLRRIFYVHPKDVSQLSLTHVADFHGKTASLHEFNEP